MVIVRIPPDFSLNLRTGAVRVDSNDLDVMLRAHELHPDRYMFDNRGSAVVITCWGKVEAAISRYDAKTGKRTTAITFRNIHSDDAGEHCRIGNKTVYRGARQPM
jgi:hypothetical protein